MWKNMPSILLILSFIQLNVLGQPPTSTILSIEIEMASPLFQTTQCQNGFQHMTHVQYSTHLTIKAYGISLIGYESVVQNTIYIKSYINKVNTTHVQIACSCQQETIFTKMRFSYILIKDDVIFIEIYSDCILCGEQDSLTGYRKWQFAVRQHTTPYSSDIQISSSLSAFNVSNVEGQGINFKLSSKMKTTDNFIYYTIEAYSWTKVVSVCITTIVYDFAKTQSIWAPYGILVKTQTKNIDWNDKATKIQPTYPCFQQPNAMFYGITAIDMMFQPKTEQVLLFDLSMPQNLNLNFKSNQNINKVQLSAFYIRQLDCPTGYFFDPQSYDCVFACPAKTGPNTVTKYCQKCHQTCATCQGSGDNKCLTCNNATLDKFRVVSSPPNKCVCDTGYIEPLDGSVICLKCSEMIENCLECTSPTLCTVCVSTYQFNPLTNKCGCANTSEYLSQGQCLSFAGCLTVLHSTNIQNYCSFCDEPKNFQFVIENNTCRCKTNYTLSPALIKCVDICGDGIVIDLACDDGNNADGDGCSSTCQQQPGYFCVGKDIQQPSLCMPMWNFSISYLYAQRDISSNEGTFVFVLSPPELKISGMNLLECLSFSFPSKIVSYEYDSVSGRLLVKAEFNESIEGVSHDFKLNMKSVKIMTNQIKSVFVVKGMNSWLIRDEYSEIYKFVIYGILVLCLLVWIVAIVVSLLGFKHLAIELVFPIQSIYLVLMEESSNAPGLRALDLMKLINGYNSLNAFKLKQISSLNDTRYYALQYLQNLNFFILINFFFIIIVFILKAIHFNKSKKVNKEKLQLHSIHDERKKDIKKCKNKAQINETNQMYQERIDCQSATIKQFEQKLKPFQKVVKYLGSRFCSLIILLIIQASIYYLGTYMILGSQSDKFSPFLNNVGCIICVGLGLFSLWIYCGFKDNQITLIINEKSKFCYTKMYMISYVVFASLLILLESFGVKGLVLIPIIQVTLILVVLILKNPYNKAKFRRPRLILPIIQQIILSVPLYLLWISGFLNTLDPLIYFITTVLIISFCFLAILITSIRTFFQWKYFALIEKKSNLEAVEQNELDEKQKLTNIKDQKITESKDNDKNNKEYETVVKQKNNSDLKDLSYDKINGVETNKRKKNESSNENEYDSISSNDDNNEEDLELIKKRLRTELKSKKAVRSK